MDVSGEMTGVRRLCGLGFYGTFKMQEITFGLLNDIRAWPGL